MTVIFDYANMSPSTLARLPSLFPIFIVLPGPTPSLASLTCSFGRRSEPLIQFTLVLPAQDCPALARPSPPADAARKIISDKVILRLYLTVWQVTRKIPNTSPPLLRP